MKEELWEYIIIAFKILFIQSQKIKHFAQCIKEKLLIVII